jgi:hypothetical protein
LTFTPMSRTHCVGLCYARYVFQRFAAQPLADLSERGPLRISEPQSRRQMRPQYAVFARQVLIAQQQLLVNEPCYICQQPCPVPVLHAGCSSSQVRAAPAAEYLTIRPHERTVPHDELYGKRLRPHSQRVRSVFPNATESGSYPGGTLTPVRLRTREHSCRPS